jgi:signal transduction histidine kinase
LAQSAELTDRLVSWNSVLSSSARERTKLMSLGNESYLRSFQVSLNEINDIYTAVVALGLDSLAGSTRDVSALHARHLEYMELLDIFSKRQAAQRAAGTAMAAVPSPASARSAAPPRKVKSASRKGNREIRPSRAKPPRRSPAKPVGPAKEIALDSAANERFKTCEQDLREGLYLVQETLRTERKDKLASLRNSVGRAKDRLIYSLLLLLAMVAYVAVILKWKILDPMKVLKQGAMEIGKGSLGHQVEVRSRNEMGELAEVFNLMSVQLEHKQNAELKVKRLEAIEQIVRSVNHEINNPLMIISGNAEYLMAILQGQPDDVKTKLASIVSESGRIFTVTQRLKEIKEPITESYIGDQDQMIDILRSSQIRPRDF